MTHGDATGSPRKVRLLAWLGELALVLTWPIGLALPVLISEVVSPAAVVILLPGFVIAWGIVCLGGFARSDPIGFSSIVGPPFAVAIIAVAVVLGGGTGAYRLALVASAWIVVWTLAASRLWPRWSRTLLRRHRPDSPEVELYNAWQALQRPWQSWSSRATGQAIWAGLLALERWETPRTRPVIDSLFAYWELATAPGADVSSAGRLGLRSQEEWDRMWAAPRVRFTKRGREMSDRPTRGTRLEYLFPRIEALLAVASPEQRTRIAVESARLANRHAGTADPILEAALDEATHGRPSYEWRERVEERLGALREVRDAPSPGVGDVDEETWKRVARQVIALSAASEAVVQGLSPVAVADVVYESIRSEYDHRQSAVYERLVADVVGPALAIDATVIEPVTIALREADATVAEPAGPASLLGQRPRRRGRFLLLLAVGSVAGLAGSVAESVWQPSPAHASGHVIDALLGQILVYLIGFGLLRPLGRPSFSDLAVLIVGSVVSSELVGPVTDLVSTALSPLVGPSRAADLVVAYPVYRGLIYGAILIAGALVLSPPRFATSGRAKRQSLAGHRTTDTTAM